MKFIEIYRNIVNPARILAKSRQKWLRQARNQRYYMRHRAEVRKKTKGILRINGKIAPSQTFYTNIFYIIRWDKVFLSIQRLNQPYPTSFYTYTCY